MVNRENIIKCGSVVFNIPNILEDKRRTEYVEARMYVIDYLRHIEGLNLKAIGSIIKKTHATIIHSLRFLEDKEDMLSRFDKKEHNIHLKNKEAVCMFFSRLKQNKINNIKMQILEKMAMVRDFNIAFKVPFCENTKDRFLESFELRKKLLHEELQELVTAKENNNIIEIADALGDLSYLAVGGLLDITNSFNFEEDYKTIKESLPIKFDEVVFLIENQINLLDKYKDMKQLVELKYSYLVLLIEAIAESFKINLHEVFEEIHLSNMSKLDENGNPILREDGKILKGKNYFKPNIEKALIVQ